MTLPFRCLDVWSVRPVFFNLRENSCRFSMKQYILESPKSRITQLLTSQSGSHSPFRIFLTRTIAQGIKYTAQLDLRCAGYEC
jgi:hypothetical protein